MTCDVTQYGVGHIHGLVLLQHYVVTVQVGLPPFLHLLEMARGRATQEGLSRITPSLKSVHKAIIARGLVFLHRANNTKLVVSNPREHTYMVTLPSTISYFE